MSLPLWLASMENLAVGLLWSTIIITVFMSSLVPLLWFERKFAGRMQTRLGPTMVGPFGFLQPVADVVKLFQKEDIVPERADRALYNLAPVLGAVAAVGTAAVVPVTPLLAGAELDVGVLFLLAIGAVNVLPVVMAGWASHNKFALLGGMRAIAQSVSYEVPLVLAALVPVILAGSMNVSTIVKYQAANHWIAVWPTFLGLPAFVLFFLSMLAESNRIPFDIPEAESELVAGITTEYTGMKFGLFYMTEYVHTLVASMVGATLFLGGWDGPFAPGPHWLALKTFFLYALVYWIRWSLLRFRSDQLLRICWNWLVPFSVLLVAATALWVVKAG